MTGAGRRGCPCGGVQALQNGVGFDLAGQREGRHELRADADPGTDLLGEGLVTGMPCAVRATSWEYSSCATVCTGHTRPCCPGLRCAPPTGVGTGMPGRQGCPELWSVGVRTRRGLAVGGFGEAAGAVAARDRAGA